MWSDCLLVGLTFAGGPSKIQTANPNSKAGPSL